MSGNSTGKKILVVNDEYFIADEPEKEPSQPGAVLIEHEGQRTEAPSLIGVSGADRGKACSFPAMEELVDFEWLAA